VMCLNVNIGEFTDISDVLGGVCPAGGADVRSPRIVGRLR